MKFMSFASGKSYERAEGSSIMDSIITQLGAQIHSPSGPLRQAPFEFVASLACSLGGRTATTTANHCNALAGPPSLARRYNGISTSVCGARARSCKNKAATTTAPRASLAPPTFCLCVITIIIIDGFHLRPQAAGRLFDSCARAPTRSPN